MNCFYWITTADSMKWQKLFLMTYKVIWYKAVLEGGHCHVLLSWDLEVSFQFRSTIFAWDCEQWCQLCGLLPLTQTYPMAPKQEWWLDRLCTVLPVPGPSSSALSASWLLAACTRPILDCSRIYITTWDIIIPPGIARELMIANLTAKCHWGFKQIV